ncbi:phosphoenolpyruvate carboxykinase (ATP) [Desertivirga arenae]|uniref:phosphoenolpyruvate carboxykinase (ATP) n=1 Tax=Desertivirga arenae TaxID=2810309 RepID=UPI001A974AB1|nr:phosphoenolpyruvate carboxykinase (ATP) [Pedobacter sp. SYSU D00823]
MINYTFNKADFRSAGRIISSNVFYQLSPEALVKETLGRGLGVLNDAGALIVKTGKFTGRSPKDKYIVSDHYTKETVSWNDFNNPVSESTFNNLYERVLQHIEGKDTWVRDASVCAESLYRLKLRVITDTPWANLFAYNMFLRLSLDELQAFGPDWLIYHIESFRAIPGQDGVRSENFSIINFSKKIILIGGTGYTGEIKKGMFSVLNMILPLEKKVLSMHCSANIGIKGDTALFFGLSGTGKTTLSADVDRYLIGDDEHGWSDNGIFNFEGGCYAKCQGLHKEKEPQIFNAIRPGALLENVVFVEGSNEIDFNDTTITENTRVSYPIHFIENAVSPSVGKVPQNIFFLTCDAYGILPPVSKLNTEQAIYHFLSGYTSKIAGTELGITEPVPTFSTCFGAPFLPLDPIEYAKLLETKIKENNVNVWLINTGWTRGPYGIGERIGLKYTRAIIRAVLHDKLDVIEYSEHSVFGVAIPTSCPGVPSSILDPGSTWKDRAEYEEKARVLADKFMNNFKKFDASVCSHFVKGGPFIS